MTEYTDAGCPWAYSASPAMAVLRWRYSEQLRWRIVTIGLAEDPQIYIDRGYTTTRAAIGAISFRRYGMPFLLAPRARVLATSPACRTIVATRLLDPAREREVLRAIQLAWFNTTLLLDEPDGLRVALAGVQGLDVEAVLATIDDEATIAQYEADKAESRTAAGGATHFQGKARQTDGPVRYSAPSLVFQGADGRRLEAGGFQTIEAYDVLIANLDPTLERRAPAEDPLEILSAFPGGLVTAELAAIMTHDNMPVDPDAAERALIEHLGTGAVQRIPLGDGALWRIA